MAKPMQSVEDKLATVRSQLEHAHNKLQVGGFTADLALLAAINALTEAVEALLVEVRSDEAILFHSGE